MNTHFDPEEKDEKKEDKPAVADNVNADTEKASVNESEEVKE